MRPAALCARVHVCGKTCLLTLRGLKPREAGAFCVDGAARSAVRKNVSAARGSASGWKVKAHLLLSLLMDTRGLHACALCSCSGQNERSLIVSDTETMNTARMQRMNSQLRGDQQRLGADAGGLFSRVSPDPLCAAARVELPINVSYKSILATASLKIKMD